MRTNEVDPDLAIELIQSEFNGIFPAQPAFSIPEHGVRFESTKGTQDDYAWVHASGRLDLCVSIRTSSAKPGPVRISTVDIASTMFIMQKAVKSKAYAKTFSEPRIGARRRFDWAVSVTPTVSVAGGGSLHWQELTFPGDIPPRVGTRQIPFCPPDGYARTALQNWSPRSPTSNAVRIFLRDFLYRSGYHRIDDAVEDTLRALDA